MEILPIHHSLDQSVSVPGSKSLTNRALLLAALANGRTRLTNALFSDDSGYFAAALQKLGFEVVLDPENCEITVTGYGGKIPSHNAELFIGNAGTAARFLSAFLTLGEGEYILDGEPRMRQRPIGDLVVTLEKLGARMEPLQPVADKKMACPPVRIFASGLPGGSASIAGDISSQFLSALLMVAPYAHHAVSLTVSTELNSRPYVDMTLAVMGEFGVFVERDHYVHFLVNQGEYKPKHSYAIESDASAASYFFAAPAILGGAVRVNNITRHSLQGDIAFLDVLEHMGCSIRQGADYVEVSGTETLRGVDIDMRDIPDMAQTLAVIAPFAASPTRIRGIASARVKETDRVAAVCAELSRLGVEVEERQDGMLIQPCADLRPASIRTYNDHRMAMAFALIGLRSPGVVIEDPGCVSKTFPGYFEVLNTLR